MDLGPETRERIIYEKAGAIARVTLNWPEKANAQDQKLAEEVDAALLDADRDYDIKVLILKANGRPRRTCSSNRPCTSGSSPSRPSPRYTATASAVALTTG